MATIIQTPKVSPRGDSGSATEPASYSSPERVPSAATERSRREEPADVVSDHRPAAREQVEREVLRARIRELEDELASVHANLERLQKASESDGYNAGIARAERELEQAKKGATSKFEALVTSLESQRTEFIRQAEDAAIEIGVSLAASIVGQVHAEGKLVPTQVKRLMKYVIDREGAVVHVSRQDYDELSRHSRELSELTGAQLVADDNIEPGSCKLKSKAGNLEARLEVQMRQLLKAIVESRNT